METEAWKFILETVGAAGQEELRRRLAETKAEFGELAAAAGRGEVEQAEFDRETKRLTDTQKNLARALKEAEGAQKGLAGAADGAAKSGANMGRSLLETGRVVQDFSQGGIGGILNNIEGLTVALGKGPGLAGVLTVVGVGFALLAPKVKEWVASLSGAGEAAERARGTLGRLEARIKELEDRTIRLAVEDRELDEALRKSKELKEARQELERMGAIRSAAERESGEQIEGMFGEAEGGAEGVRGRLTAQRTKELLAQNQFLNESARRLEDLRRAKEQFERQGEGGEAMAAGTRAAIERIEEERRKERLKVEGEAGVQVGQMFGDATAGRGPRQRAAQRSLGRALRGAGLGPLAEGVEASGPEELQEQAELDQRLEGQEEDHKLAKGQAKRAREARERKAAEAKREADRADKEAEAHGEYTPEAIQGRMAKREADAREKELADRGHAAAQAAEAIVKGQVKPPPGVFVPDRERLARQIYQQAGGQFTPDQARQAANESLKLQQRGVGALEATQYAVAHTQQVVAELMARVQMLGGNAKQLQRNAARMQAQNRGFQNDGWGP